MKQILLFSESIFCRNPFDFLSIPCYISSDVETCKWELECVLSRKCFADPLSLEFDVHDDSLHGSLCCHVCIRCPLSHRLTVALWKLWGFFTPFILYIAFCCFISIVSLFYPVCNKHVQLYRIEDSTSPKNKAGTIDLGVENLHPKCSWHLLQIKISQA